MLVEWRIFEQYHFVYEIIELLHLHLIKYWVNLMYRESIRLLAKDFTVRIVESTSSANEFASANASCTFFCCFYIKQKSFLLNKTN
jgi:hypothetical protein